MPALLAFMDAWGISDNRNRDVRLTVTQSRFGLLDSLRDADLKLPSFEQLFRDVLMVLVLLGPIA
jgi:hypothetical protein